MTQIPLQKVRISRRNFLRGTTVLGGASLVAGFYTWQIEPHWLQVVERNLPIAYLPDSLVGARMAQLSDLHIGPQVDDGYLLNVFARVRALAPDLVVYTGDFVTCWPDVPENAARMLPHLPLGSRATFAVLGNHDYGRDHDRMDIGDRVAAMVENAGANVLRNQVGAVDGLQVVGCDDFWAGRFSITQALSTFDPSAAGIVLCHNPDAADLTGWDKFTGWILVGHTHGGQCKPPFLPPPISAVKNSRYISGEFELSGDRRMYINRGVGHLLQVRFNARPEVTIFTLEKT